MNSLPAFRYHPDPVSTGSVAASGAICVCCQQARGFIYVGPVYAPEDYEDCVCPWCIADGSASERLDASFGDEAGIGGYGDWDVVPSNVIEEIALRTPGIISWQQAQWWTHCGDAGEFLGPMGHSQLESLGPDAVKSIQINAGVVESDWEQFYRALDKDRGPTAYLFRCRHCGIHGGYWDCH